MRTNRAQRLDFGSVGVIILEKTDRLVRMGKQNARKLSQLEFRPRRNAKSKEKAVIKKADTP